MSGLSEYEKKRLANIKENNEILRGLGLLSGTQKTERKRPNKRRKRKDDSDSEDEWLPGLPEEPKPFSRQKVTVLKPEERKPLARIVLQADEKFTTALINRKSILPGRRCKKSLQQPLPVKVPVSALPEWLQSDDDDEKIDFEGFHLEEVLEEEAEALKCINEKDYSLFYEGMGESDSEESDFEGFELNQIDVLRTEKRRYPKRSTAKKTYTEEELSDEDEYLFCEDCQKIHHGDCPVHGPLATLNPSSGYDTASLQYTSVPVPKELTVKESKIPKAGLGVFATELIPNGVKFGPYKGQKVYYEDIDEDDDTSYMWEIKKPNESYYIDGQVESESNWMRYINCARNEEEQNLVAFQYHGEIYYRTFKDICPGTELFVWYGDQYAKDLGIETTVNNYGLFICKRCSNRFKSKSNFKIHLQANKDCFKANPQIFTCGRCQESFYTLHKLQDHIRKHEEVKVETKIRFVKIEENLTNIEEQYWDGTKRRRKADCQRRFHCEYCNKSFTLRGNLNTHIRIHTGETYHCQYCDKSFTIRDNLDRHIRIHTGEKPYHCEYCDASFTQRGNLNTHIRIHTGEKPYHCKYCDASFTESGTLNTHIRIHTGEKPYHCKYCDASFTQRSNLNTHIRIHTGEKPYHCEYCDASFTESGHLNTHIRTHTGEKPYHCKYCDKSFTQSSILTRHIRAIHN